MRLGPYTRALLVLLALYLILAVAATILELSKTGGRIEPHHVAAWLVGAIIFVGTFAIISGAFWLAERNVAQAPTSRIRRLVGGIGVLAAMAGAFVMMEAAFDWLGVESDRGEGDLVLGLILLALAVPAMILREFIGWIRERRSKAAPRPPSAPAGPATSGSD